MKKKESVVVLGASSKPSRYSNMALKLLLEHQHHVIPVHPKLQEIEGLGVSNSLAQISEKVDTVTLYVNPTLGLKYLDELVELSPKRVIMNPGTESEELRAKLVSHDIQVEEACTLVLLNTGQF